MNLYKKDKSPRKLLAFLLKTIETALFRILCFFSLFFFKFSFFSNQWDAELCMSPISGNDEENILISKYFRNKNLNELYGIISWNIELKHWSSILQLSELINDFQQKKTFFSLNFLLFLFVFFARNKQN